MAQKFRLTRRACIRMLSFTLAAFIALGSAVLLSSREANFYKVRLEENYQRSLNELNGYLSNIDTTLNKGIYANTDTMIAQLSSALWRQTSGAKSALSVLPLSELNLENAYKFLSQVGEFSMALNKKVAAGGKITKEEHDSLVKLASLSEAFSKSVDSTLEYYSNGSSILGNENPVLSSAQGSYPLTSGFTDAEESMVDYPTLIYDGPFSDHLMQSKPRMLEGQEEVSRETALLAASKVSGIAPADLKADNDTQGKMPCYGFKNETTNISITKKGGFVCYMLSSREVKNQSLAPEQAIEKARAFLKEHGYSNMKESYYAINNGVCVVNFAYVQNGVICYPDLIKVGVAMDNGGIISMDARGYLANHTERAIPNAKISLEQAKNNLSSYVTVMSSRTAVIPTASNSEKTAYEFHCKSKTEDQELLIYISTQTGKEEDILFLLYSDNGVLTK